MRILITGGHGFIGRHLHDRLLEEGHDVFSVDRSHGDLRESGVFKSHLQDVSPHVVFHLAAQVGRLFGEQDVIHTVSSNAQMTSLVAKACGEAGVTLYYASTSEIYGDFGNQWVVESTLPRLPHNLYGLTKRWGEEVCKLYVSPTELTVLRFSMPYGPGVPPGKGRAALPNLLWQAHNRMPMIVHKGAERSWCWIGDTIDAVCAVFNSRLRGPFNIGRSDAAISMYDAALLCCEATGASTDLIQEVDPPQAQTVVKRLSTTRLEYLGWTPKVDLHEGILRVLEWVRRFDSEGNLISPLPEKEYETS